MSSGRSARLPPTPAAAAAASATTTTTTTVNKPRGIHHTLPEPNSNNVLPTNSYGHINTKSNSNSNNVMVGGSVGLGAGMGAGSGGGNGIAGIPMMGGMMQTTGTTNLTSGMGMMGGYTNVVGGGGLGGGVGGNNSIRTIDAATEGIPCETIDAFGPELAVATSQVLENLSEAERKMIIEVLNRDENVRQRDATRIM